MFGNIYTKRLYLCSWYLTRDKRTKNTVYVFIGLRGGVSMVSQRFAAANNHHMADYDPAKPSSYLLYLDASNLYGWAMSQALPMSNFAWVSTMIICTCNMNYLHSHVLPKCVLTASLCNFDK